MIYVLEDSINKSRTFYSVVHSFASLHTFYESNSDECQVVFKNLKEWWEECTEEPILGTFKKGQREKEDLVLRDSFDLYLYFFVFFWDFVERANGKMRVCWF